MTLNYRTVLLPGAISNFDNRLHDILPCLGIAQYLHFIITSEDAKSSKPDPEIFNLAARTSLLPDLRPEEILHIGRWRMVVL